ncbi:hypothetical protein H2200_002199 [Cladophialophora chaetospira]|uniref:Uncharacterized protein n=1 Tax=Cladophialophora chaetospira TaxID=386627 RepID=A0AA39CNA3_9EURO|nr:hypothetical protein H2200_002199 [Cladophialophora chaetospira]
MDHRIEALENPKKAHCQGTAFEKSSEPSTVRLESFHGFPSSTQERPIQNFQYSTHKAKWGNPAPFGTYYFMGGTLMVIAGILEFFLGNTFPFVVSCGFGKRINGPDKKAEKNHRSSHDASTLTLMWRPANESPIHRWPLADIGRYVNPWIRRLGSIRKRSTREPVPRAHGTELLGQLW